MRLGLPSIACLAVFSSACGEDTVGNPFNATEAPGSSTAADGDDDSPGPGSNSASGTPGDESTSTGMPMTTAVVDDTFGESSDGTTMTMLESTDTGREDDLGESSSSSSTDGGDEMMNDDGPMGTPCPFDTIESVPFTLTGTTVGEASEFGSGCGGFGAPDNAYVVTAAFDGFYVFNTFGAGPLDTILYVLDGECTGSVLACNDDTAGQGLKSQVSVQLVAGQVVTVVVDGFGLSGGMYTLNGAAYSGVCPNQDLGNTMPLVHNGSTAGADNTVFGTCGGNQANDETFTWTAPAAGIYTISTEGSAYDTVLYIRNGSCNGNQIGCNDNTTGGTHSRLNVNLANNQTIVIAVDGAGLASGNFTLNITEAMDSGNCCVSHPTTGCDDPAVQQCVCAFDPFCCNTSWDGLCVNGAINSCNAICP